MTPLHFILASLRHYRRIHLSVAAGVVVATAVLTGALLVGDSVRGSLRDLTLQRLGQIDSALVAGHLFRDALAEELAADPSFQRHFVAAEPVILMVGSLQAGSGKSVRRATQVSLIGTRPGYWSLGEGGPQEQLGQDGIALTEPLARELRVEVGDRLLLRVPVVSATPADSVLGEKSETSRSRSFRVAAVLPDRGLARFGLTPSQHAPRNAWLSLSALQGVIEQAGKANGILVAGASVDHPSSEIAQEALRKALRPAPEDYGLAIEEIDTPVNAITIAAGQLVLAPEAVRSAKRAFGESNLQPIVTYLANTISKSAGDAERKIPYSTVTGVNSTSELGPLFDAEGQPIRLADDEIALNRWAANQLEARVGDTITLKFYEPESIHGELREHDPIAFRLVHIAELETAEGELTAAADPSLTPELPGVTDQKSINDWDLPFELVETIHDSDEAYWDDYRTTPKAFVSLDTAKRLWASRWGTISLLRLPASTDDATAPLTPANLTVDDVSERLLDEIDPSSLGMAFLPVKSQGLSAASGTTPFDALFLGFSFFLIGAAIMLISLLFQLGVQQRAKELGILAATGVGPVQITRLLSREGFMVAAFGAIVGVAAGVVYAWLMILGLRTWWVDAIVTPFLDLHVTLRSLLLGWLVGVFVSWLTIRWSIRRMARLSAWRLLGGSDRGQLAQTSDEARSRRAGTWHWWAKARIVLAMLVVALVLLGFRLQGEGQAGVFFASGAVMLVLLLSEIRHHLRAARLGLSPQVGWSLPALATLNIARHPGRSTLTIGLVASASFLILAIGAFRLEATDAGTGGFALLATSDRPVHFDLNTPEGRLELGFSDSASDRIAEWRIHSLRVADGEDASCLNLYRPTQPRVLGVPNGMIDRGGFAWGGTLDRSRAAIDESEAPTSAANMTDLSNPWTLLRVDLGRDSNGKAVVPVVLDSSTARYSLGLDVGKRWEIRDGADQPVTLEVVGLLKNSMLQGVLLISEENFLRLFPDVGGYRFFLMEPHGKQAGAGSRESEPRSEPIQHDRPSAGGAGEIAEILESTLATEGYDVVDTRERLAGYLAVQNTYLSTFQTIGLLGLLLGTVGLAVVQLRSVMERRGELALMRAAGFRRGRLVRMVLWENGVLLLGGLVVGAIAAAVATMPQWARHEAEIPWATVALLLSVIALVGLFAGWLATRSALRAPLLPALRGD